MKPFIKMLYSTPRFRYIMAAVIAGLLVWGVLALAPQPLLIKVDGKPIVYRSLFRTVGAVLSGAGVKLGPKDAVQPDPGTPVNREMVISVNRAVSIRMNVDGRSILVLTPKVPVQDVLQVARVKLGTLDQVTPPPAQVVAAGTVINVKRVALKLVTENYEIPVPVARMDDPQMERGESRQVSAGAPGEAQRLVSITYVNGNPVKRLLVRDTVLRSPQRRLIAYGTVTSVSRGGRTVRFSNSIETVSTAYSLKDGWYTCTGQRVHFGIVAVDPSVIPLGTRLYIDGYGYATAEDIGSAIKGNRIDVFFESAGDAENWGRRETKVYVLDE